eukprot:TRINITY_DN18962_c0_g1_i2.p1 TRINITY_DN18962_c0_g1~~TRINITY_DN18962_c0_g1_i2.p1  ORF type:complete len:371 (+),score=87.86 TRINITY_DN18962_c0_g1_i2:219-1331(+)
MSSDDITANDELAAAIDYTVRFSFLAYLNKEETVVEQIHEDVVRIHVLALESASLSVILYKLPPSSAAPVGVVLSYRGTGGGADWWNNFRAAPYPFRKVSQMDADFERSWLARAGAVGRYGWGALTGLFGKIGKWGRKVLGMSPKKELIQKMLKDADVHRGFALYKKALDDAMAEVQLASEPVLAAALERWNVQYDEGEEKPKTLRDFVYYGDWQFLIATGHSKGGALAHIAALDIARAQFEKDEALSARKDVTREEVQEQIGRSEGTRKKVMLATVASPLVGNEIFFDSLEALTYARLRVFQRADLVPHTGFMGIKWARNSRSSHGLAVVMDTEKDKVTSHLCYQVWSSFADATTCEERPLREQVTMAI